MTDAQRGKDHLEKLLSAARTNIRLLESDLIDVECAKRSAELSLESIKTAAGKGPIHRDCSNGTGELSRDRLLNLQTTIMTLSRTHEEIEKRLAEARKEITKLERLMDLNGRAAGKGPGGAPVREGRPASLPPARTAG